MEMIKKSKRTLAPVHELVMNALEAILKNPGLPEEAKEILIRFNFIQLLNEMRSLESIDVIDRGVGFDDENFERFETLLDKSKGYFNRGSGRIQLLHRFNHVLVESYFRQGGQLCVRKFECSPNQFVYNKQFDFSLQEHATGTRVTLLQPIMNKSERETYDTLTAEKLKQDLREHLALWFYLDSNNEMPLAPTIRINFFTKNQLPDPGTEERILSAADVPPPASKDTLRVPYVVPKRDETGRVVWRAVVDKFEPVQWAHFKLPESELEKNGIWLCSKNVTVEQFEFGRIKRKQSFEGHRYLTVFYGKLFDDDGNVSHEVDCFRFPRKKDIEKDITDQLFHDEDKELITRDDLDDVIRGVLPVIYTDLMEAQRELRKDVFALAEAHGIPTEIAEQVDVQVGDTEEKITDKLYKKQAEELAERNTQIKKIYEELVSLNPTDENYQEELIERSSELLARIPQQNKEELSRYIIRREMVAKILRLINNKALDYQRQPRVPGKKKNKEFLIHDLIIRRRSDSADDLNDLWVLNEEFVHYEGCSDLPLDKISLRDGRKLLREISKKEIAEFRLSTDLKPDIFLFPGEGKCVLVELKAQDANLADHLGQMTKYCNLIANYGALPINRFYCYLIGEKLAPIDVINDCEPTVNDDWVHHEQQIRSIHDNKVIIGHIYSEIILLSSVAARAERRNKSFAERLGVRVS